MKRKPKVPPIDFDKVEPFPWIPPLIQQHYLGFRVDAELKTWFLTYCREHAVNPSKALRAILMQYRELCVPRETFKTEPVDGFAVPGRE
jgi:hypothetical protein